MAKIIDDETMENVCILAKLSLTEDEKEKAKEDMQKMLDYVDKLDELDTSSVEPMLANAPKQKENQYQVPKTIG